MVKTMQSKSIPKNTSPLTMIKYSQGLYSHATLDAIEGATNPRNNQTINWKNDMKDC